LWILPVAAALLVKKSADLVANVIFLSIFSLVVAALYLRMAAPDVAITEAAIGAAVSTLFYLAAIKNTKDHNVQPDTNRLPAVIILGSLSLVLLSLLPDIPLFGSEQTPANLHVGSYYIQNTLSQTGVPNAVTSVLASYRSYDTLGETYVIFTAGIAVLLILPRMKVKKPTKKIVKKAVNE
jgi:multicomponent Na+:H+ antiporter subunit B